MLSSLIDMGDNFRNCFHMQIQEKKKHEDEKDVCPHVNIFKLTRTPLKQISQFPSFFKFPLIYFQIKSSRHKSLTGVQVKTA